MWLTIILLPFFPLHQVDAATTGNQVMLVYDSQNKSDEKPHDIDVLQRSLTSMGLNVQTVSQADYHKGMLTSKYQAVITMINWPEVGLTNQDFIHDRARFKGIELHIGQDLTEDESHRLQAAPKKLYQQQLILKSQGSSQVLPFSETLTVFDHLPTSAQRFGQLSPQQNDQPSYPYGLIQGNMGYLPYFEGKGLSLIVALDLMAHLFHRVVSSRPLLTITGVSPYVDLKLLQELGAFLQKNQIPFAISTVTVSDNTELRAYRDFTKVLRRIELDDGVIFMQVPKIGGATAADATLLNQVVDTSLVNLANYQVYPVGLSAPGYWNQDKLLRSASLKKSQAWLLLSNRTPLYLHQDNRSQVSEGKSWLTLSIKSVMSVQKLPSRFDSPTALTVPMPSRKTQLTEIERQITKLPLDWYDPVSEQMKTQIETGGVLIAYDSGQYILNGRDKQITMSTPHLAQQMKQAPATRPLFKGFFKVEGVILLIFFSLVLIVLLIFVRIGRKHYIKKFKSKNGEGVD